jgi:AMMECR1 domain-containing protein
LPAARHNAQVGTHGLIIDFQDPLSGAARSATYLPEIAERERWSRRAAIESLIRKAGYSGAIGDALLRSLRVTRYQSSPLTRRYEEFEEARRRNAEKSAAKRRSSGTEGAPAATANGW